MGEKKAIKSIKYIYNSLYGLNKKIKTFENVLN